MLKKNEKNNKQNAKKLIDDLFETCKVPEKLCLETIQNLVHEVQKISEFEDDVEINKIWETMDEYFSLITLVKNEKAEPKNRLDISDEQGNTCLHYICFSDFPSTDILEFLLAQKVNPNIQNNQGETPLHVACSNKFPQGITIDLLLEHRADPNVGNCDGMTPLHKACLNNLISKNCIENILKWGGDLNIVDQKFERNALHWACCIADKNYSYDAEVIKLLISKYDSNAIHRVDKKGQNYLDLFCHGQIYVNDELIDIVDFMIKWGVQLTENSYCLYDICHANTDGNEKICDLVLPLLKLKANPNRVRPTDTGLSIIYHFLAYEIQWGDPIDTNMYRPDIIKLLIAYKADVNYLAHANGTPFALAFNFKPVNYDVIFPMLAHKADVNSAHQSLIEEALPSCLEMARAQEDLLLTVSLLLCGADVNQITCEEENENVYEENKLSFLEEENLIYKENKLYFLNKLIYRLQKVSQKQRNVFYSTLKHCLFEDFNMGNDFAHLYLSKKSKVSIMNFLSTMHYGFLPQKQTNDDILSSPSSRHNYRNKLKPPKVILQKILKEYLKRVSQDDADTDLSMSSYEEMEYMAESAEKSQGGPVDELDDLGNDCHSSEDFSENMEDEQNIHDDQNRDDELSHENSIQGEQDERDFSKNHDKIPRNTYLDYYSQASIWVLFNKSPEAISLLINEAWHTLEMRHLLHKACQDKTPNINTIHMLLKNKADPNEKNDKGLTPLHLICENPNLNAVPIIECLFVYKADPNVKNDIVSEVDTNSACDFYKHGYECNVLHWACGNYSNTSSIEVLKLLLTRVEPTALSRTKTTPLMDLISWSPLFQKRHEQSAKVHEHQLQVIKLLLQSGIKPGHVETNEDLNPFAFLRPELTSLEVVQTLLEAKLSPNGIDAWGGEIDVPILNRYLCDPRYLDNYERELDMGFIYHPEIAKLMLRYNADPKLGMEKGNLVEFQTPLQLLARRDPEDVDYELVHLLLEKGAGVGDLSEDMRDSPLLLAYYQKNIHLILLFICHGANVNDINLPEESQDNRFSDEWSNIIKLLRDLRQYQPEILKKAVTYMKNFLISKEIDLEKDGPSLAQNIRQNILSFLLAMKHHSLWKRTLSKPPKTVQKLIVQQYINSGISGEDHLLKNEALSLQLLHRHLRKITADSVTKNILGHYIEIFVGKMAYFTDLNNQLLNNSNTKLLNNEGSKKRKSPLNPLELDIDSGCSHRDNKSFR